MSWIFLFVSLQDTVHSHYPSRLDVPQSPSLFPTPLYEEDSYFYTSEKETNTFGARHYIYIFASFLKQKVIKYLLWTRYYTNCIYHDLCHQKIYTAIEEGI